MSADVSLTLEAFIRSISINRDTPHSLFLGAGASISSGIPSAERCILEWKGRIFTSANPALEKQVGHLSLPSVQRRIQTWISKQVGFPPPGDASEYSFFFEHCYPLAQDRRAYFQNLVKAAHPNFGYEMLAVMAEAGVFDSVWSTNFDGLPARAVVGSPVTAIEIGLDSPQLQLSVAMESVPGRAAKRKVRAHFRFSGISYVIAVTDPDWESSYKQKGDGDYLIGDAILCISLGETYAGYAYKLVAGIFTKKTCR